MERIDSCFRVIRKYLDDNPRMELDAYALSQALDIDIFDIRTLIDLKYFEPIVIPGTKDEVTKKVKLARRIQTSLAQSLGMRESPLSEEAGESGKTNGARNDPDSLNAMFAQDRHGSRRKER
jgi:hypothetical protein